MTSGAGGAGLFRGGTTLWLMCFLLSFADTLPTGAFVIKMTESGEERIPQMSDICVTCC
jgi:hypothetical protein